MKGEQYYCNCQAKCIHKGKLRKVKVYKNGKNYKLKAQVCLNDKNDCTCSYRVKVYNAFMF